MPRQNSNKVVECRVLRVVTASLIGNRGTTVLSMWGIAILLLWITATNLNAQSSGCGPGGPTGGGPNQTGVPPISPPMPPTSPGGSQNVPPVNSHDPNSLTGPNGFGIQNYLIEAD